MQIENVAGVGFASGRTVQQQRECTVSHRVLGKVIINDQHVLALVHEKLADGAARIGRDILQRGGFRRGRGNDDGVIHRAVRRQRLGNLCHGRALLSDRDVDADNAGPLLVDDGIKPNGGFTGLAVADDKLTLPAADRDHRVDRLNAGLQRDIYGSALNNAGRGHFNRAGLTGFDRAFAVDRRAERVNNTAKQGFANRHGHDAPGALDGIALTDFLIRTQQNGADEILF